MSSIATTNKRPLVFLAVGVVNTLLDFAFYTLLTQTIFSNQSDIAIVGFLSGTFALFCAFLTHSFITWRGAAINYKTLIKFTIFTGFGLWVIRPLLLTIFIQITAVYSWAFSLSQTLNLPMSYSFIANTGAFGLMVVIILVYNYFVYSRFVFKDQSIDQENH